MRKRGTGGGRGHCDHCNLDMDDGPDVCLGYLPGVSHACCGHGNPEDAYVVLGGRPNQSVLSIENHVSVYGQDAVTVFEIIARARDEEANRPPFA